MTESEASARSLTIVGLGASAGGLQALQEVLANVPPGTDAAIVVVQHLSPDFETRMDELLAAHTSLPVKRVENEMLLEPGTIYLMPPKVEMIVAGGRLLLSERASDHGLWLPIDSFLRSMAEECGPRAVGVILSGTGSDGSRGLRAIHESGGAVIVQEPSTARFDGMPRSAIDTGLADIVLHPTKIGEAIARFAQRAVGDETPFRAGDERQGVDGVFEVLERDTGVDFSVYKSSTIERRVERRLVMTGTADVEQYLEMLRADPAEREALYRDLLIGVTSFFRDPEAFAKLDQDILQELVRKVPEHEPLRVWVAACATGEEAYSIAISVHEAFRKLDRKPRLRLFATDVHRGSIERAGAGIYDASALGEMDPDLRDRYFVRDPGGYRVAEHLRNSIVFAYHNVLRDAPFTKLDLVCCRNLMIYFNQQAQRKVLSLFHFGLRTGGVLFLGPSETPGFLAEEFGTVDRRWKIYRKRRELRLAPDLGPLRPFRPSSARSSSVEKQEDVLDRARAELLERFAPPSLVIGPDHALLHVSGGASRFLTHREGSPSLQILDMVAGELKYALAGALKRSREGSGGRVVRYEGVPFESEGASSRIAVSVSRLGGENDPILVVLEPMPESGQAANDALPIDSLTRERMEALEQELRYAKENLQATIEEMEASNEELQATNEELIASNEELQSANEELQSVNEELHTVNAEHQHKIVELQQLTNDIEHLFQATDVHTVFLDGELRIRKFTPKMAETFHLIESDEGRTIETFSHRLRHDALTDELRRVLQHGVRIEHEVEDQSGCNYLMRVLPYRPRERVEGVVLTLVDVSNVRRTERALAESKNELAAILENSPTPIYARDAAGKLLMASPSARTMLESAPAGLTEDEDRAMNRAEVVKTEQEFVIDGRARTFFCTNFPVRGHRGDVVLVAGVMIDITDRKADERKQIEALQQRDRFLAMLSHELRNPLAAISSAAHIISEESSEETSRAANVLLRQTEHMKDLLADLLDVNRITLDRLAMEKRAVELREVVDRSFETVDLAARQRQIELVRPNDLDGIVLVADPARLQQLVTNVLVNGVKFSDPGSKVELDVHRRGQRIAVRITDTGIGLDRDQLDKIFALFYQGEQDLGRSSGGLGVGLSLARTIAEAHGGTIAAHSSGSGKGATFEIELPLPTPAELARCEGVHETLKSAPTRALEVVIVDDQRDNREMLAMLVSLSGHRTIAVADGEEAVATILRVRPQLALVDIGLPGMDGYEVARRIRAQGAGPKLYLAALTGYGRDEDRKLSREAGFDEHVVKPLSRDELQRVLQNAAARATTAESETHASTSS